MLNELVTLPIHIECKTAKEENLLPNPLKAAIYLRKSRADMEAEARGEGETLSRHKRVLLQLASDYHYLVCEIYQEIVSGDQLAQRPQAQLMLQAVSEGSFHAVLCMDLDRLGRGNLIDQGIIQQVFKSSGTLVVTPRKIYNLRDEWDEEWSEFEAFFARRELKMITRRLQRGRRYSAAEGKSISQRPPYGYFRNEHLKLEPNPTTAPIVKQIFEWANCGISLREIARRLNANAIPSPKGGAWGASTIAFILQNHAYTGTIVWGKNRYLKSGAKYLKEHVPEELWIKKEHAHPALIAKEDFTAFTPSPTSDVPIFQNTHHELASLILCYHCHRPMQFRKSYGKRQDRLLCTTPLCPCKSIAYPLLQQKLYETILHLYEFAKDDPLIAGADLTLFTALTMSSPPSWQRQALIQVVDRITYRRDRDWPDDHPVQLEIWLKF